MMHFDTTMSPFDTLHDVRCHVLMLASLIAGPEPLDLGQDATNAFHANLLAVAGGIEAAVARIEAATPYNTVTPSRAAPALTEPRQANRAAAPKRSQRAA